MKYKNTLFEVMLSVVVIGLAIALIDPLHYWMTTMMEKIVLGLLVIAFSVFAAFVWREAPHDERELLHRSIAGRVAFLAGLTVLVVGIAVQVFNHRVDGWLVGTLVAMVLAKFIGLQCAGYKQ